MHATRFTVIASSLLVAVAGCYNVSNPAASDSIGGSRHEAVSRATLDGLVQTLSVSSDSISEGDNLLITAVLRNDGSKAVRAYAGYSCRLDQLETDLRFDAGECMVPTAVIDLSPGDSVVGRRGGAVASAAGTYHVRVRQAPDAPLWAELSVTVRAK